MGHAVNPIAVTGAQGYLGSHVVKGLKDQGISVVGIGRSDQADITCDLTDGAALARVFSQHPFSTVVHCASLVPKSIADYANDEAAQQSLLMVHNLIEVAPKSLIFASSMTVYSPDSPMPVREEDGGLQTTSYARGKWDAEQALLASSVPCLILRLPGLFGGARKSGLLYNAAVAMIQKAMPSLPEPPLMWSAMHVEDAAGLIVRAALAPPQTSLVLNVGYPGLLSIPLAIKKLAELLDMPVPKMIDEPGFGMNLDRLTALYGPVETTFDARLAELVQTVTSDQGRQDD